VFAATTAISIMSSAFTAVKVWTRPAWEIRDERGAKPAINRHDRMAPKDIA
jgi:hypothetical protein